MRLNSDSPSFSTSSILSLRAVSAAVVFKLHPLSAVVTNTHPRTSHSAISACLDVSDYTQSRSTQSHPLYLLYLAAHRAADLLRSPPLLSMPCCVRHSYRAHHPPFPCPFVYRLQFPSVQIWRCGLYLHCVYTLSRSHHTSILDVSHHWCSGTKAVDSAL